MCGHEDEARNALASLSELAASQYVSPALFMILHGSLGERDRSFEWADKAFEERAGLLIFLASVKPPRALRGDPRHTELRKRMGLER